MSTEKPRITIVGLGLIGSSIGLALRDAGVASTVVGHDKEPRASSQAKKLGAVDRTDWNLISACEDSDLVVLAIPLAGIKPTLQALSPYLRPGCVVMDTATLKQPVLAWANEALPDQVHFVGGNPIISQPMAGQSGPEAARADLFRNGLFCLTPSPSAEPAAVKLASDLAAVLGSKPLFIDPAEHDGLLAAVEHLPIVLAVALLDTVIHQPTWRELWKVAGASFEVGTQLASTDPAGYGELCAANRENIIRWIDAFAAVLASLRQDLVQGESEEISLADSLSQRLEHALEKRDRWLRDRAQGEWEGEQPVAMPAKGSILADALIGGWWRKGKGRERE